MPRLVHGLVRVCSKTPPLYRDLVAYAVPELETLESPSAWIDRLATEAIGASKPIDDLDQAVFSQALRGAPMSQDTDD